MAPATTIVFPPHGGMNTGLLRYRPWSHASTTASGMICAQVGSPHIPSYSNEPLDTASHLVTVALHVIIMIHKNNDWAWAMNKDVTVLACQFCRYYNDWHAVVAITHSALASHTTTSGFHELSGPNVQKIIHFIYITILIANVISDTVDVVQFPRDAGIDKELTKHMHNIWILGVAVSWCWFFTDINIIVRVTKSSSIGPQAGTRCDPDRTYKIIIAHQVLVILFEDFLIIFCRYFTCCVRSRAPLWPTKSL